MIHKEFTAPILGNADFTYYSRAKPIKILSIGVLLTTDGTAGNRMPRIYFRDCQPANFFTLTSYVYTVASKSNFHLWAQGMNSNYTSAHGLDYFHPLPENILDKDESFRVSVDGGLVTDRFQVIFTWEYVEAETCMSEK